MKYFLGLLMFFLCFFTYAQNIEDPYFNFVVSPVVWDDDLQNFSGEYKIFTDKLFWNKDVYGLSTSAISVSIEIVSFPFVPEGIVNCNNSSSRVLSTDIVKDATHYGLIELMYNNEAYQTGRGWVYEGFEIFQKTDNCRNCPNDIGTNDACEGNYGLISEAYATALAPNQSQNDGPVFFPHTILKHTLYFHCGESIDDPGIDSLSWLYDNTRGRMNDYPFRKPTRGGEILVTPEIDVTFRPTFNSSEDDVPYPPNLWSENGANGYYDSGLDHNHGSINYFPPEEIDNPKICDDGYNLYYYSGYGSQVSFASNHANNEYNSLFVHPPSYALLDAPLLNYEGNRYAGYETNGTKMAGLVQIYEIKDEFDLQIINPVEKIIYNPSKVSIYCDLTFPCGYQFRTLHGKYPDRTELEAREFPPIYWDEIHGFDFEFDKDYPIPVNDTTNSEYTSIYVLKNGITLTFAPPVIIMDAHFEGNSPTNKACIHLDPNKTYGNWTYDSTTVELNTNLLTLPVCTTNDPNIESFGNKSANNCNSTKEEPNVHLKVLNGLTLHPYIQVEINKFQNTKILVYNSMGNLMHSKKIVSDKQTIDFSFLKHGIYHAVLMNNNELIERISFGKK